MREEIIDKTKSITGTEEETGSERKETSLLLKQEGEATDRNGKVEGNFAMEWEE